MIIERADRIDHQQDILLKQLLLQLESSRYTDTEIACAHGLVSSWYRRLASGGQIHIVDACKIPGRVIPDGNTDIIIQLQSYFTHVAAFYPVQGRIIRP